MANNDQNTDSWQKKFFKSLGEPPALLELFEFLPQIYMYVKDCDGRYLRANRVVCRVVGVESDAEMIGRTDFDFFPPAIAAQYVDEDRRVIDSAAPLTDQIWLVPDNNGIPQIYSCSKIPLFDRKQTVIGIAGVKRPYDQTATATGAHAIRHLAFRRRNRGGGPGRKGESFVQPASSRVFTMFRHHAKPLHP